MCIGWNSSDASSFTELLRHQIFRVEQTLNSKCTLTHSPVLKRAPNAPNSALLLIPTPLIMLTDLMAHNMPKRDQICLNDKRFYNELFCFQWSTSFKLKIYTLKKSRLSLSLVLCQKCHRKHIKCHQVLHIYGDLRHYTIDSVLWNLFTWSMSIISHFIWVIPAILVGLLGVDQQLYWADILYLQPLLVLAGKAGTEDIHANAKGL